MSEVRMKLAFLLAERYAMDILKLRMNTISDEYP